MPRHKHRHRRNLGYWLRRLIPSLGRKKKRVRHEREESSNDLRFLTIEEVKAAQAGIEASERDSSTVDATEPPEMANRPQLPHMQLHRRRKKDIGHKLRSFLSRISFEVWKNKYSSSSSGDYRYLSHEEIKKAKENLKTAEAQSFGNENRITQKPDISHDSGDVHRQRRRKRRSWRVFNFFRRKPKARPVLIFKPEDLLELENETLELGVYIRPIINSTAMFMIAYQLSWFVYQLAVMVVASFSRIDSVLFYYEVMFPIGNSSPKWNQTNIIFITLAGPMISLFLWAIYRLVFLTRFHPGPQMRLFLVWLYLNSIMLFFGAFVGGAITRQGFGYVVDWMYMNIAIRILFSLIFLILIIWNSWNVVRFLPENAGKDSWRSNRYRYVLSRLVIPWFLGGGIMVLLKITDAVPQHENIFNYDVINLATLVFAIIPPLFNSKTSPHLIQNRKAYPHVHRITVAVWSIIAIVLVLLVRIGLSRGVLFQFIFDLNIGFYH